MEEQDEDNAELASCVKCEHQDERPALIKQRMAKLCFPSLQALAVDHILTNLQLFSVCPFYLKQLPDRIREMLLRQLAIRSAIPMRRLTFYFRNTLENEDYFDDLFTTFQQLLTSCCTQFNLDWLMVYCPEEDKSEMAAKVLSHLRSEAPNLETLEMNLLFHDEDYDMYTIQAWSYSDEIFRKSVLALKNLKILKIPRLPLHPDDLIALGENLPLLEHLQCALGGDAELGEYQEAATQMIGRLKRLRNFEFDQTQREPFYEIKQFSFFCLVRFPQLETIGAKMFSHSGYIKQEIKFSELELEPRGNLTRLNLYWQLPDRVFQKMIRQKMLPNIQSLTVTAQEESWNPQTYLRLLSLPKVTELTVMSEAHKLVPAFGSKLRKLSIESDYQGISFEDLVQHCPRLKELSMEASPLHLPNSPNNTLTLDFLTTLEIGSRWRNYNMTAGQVASLLMRTPNLEIFNWRGIYKEDFSEMRRLVRSKMIFSKLVSMQISMFRNDADVPDFQARLSIVDEFIEDVCAYAPKLESVKAGNDHDWIRLFDRCCVTKCIDLVHQLSVKNRIHF